MSSTRALSLTAFLTLLLVGLMMGANHVAARLAFGSGLDVATAVAVRSGVTALVVGLLIVTARVPLRAMGGRPRNALLLIGVLIGVQSQCLYSSVARLPVALALLAFNTYPLFTAMWDRLIYGHAPSRAMVGAMPVILLGLGLALDVLGAASGLGAGTQWVQMGAGVAFALAAAASFGLALILTQHETQGLDGRWRTLFNMAAACVIALAVVGWHGAPQWPGSTFGWLGLAALSFLYGTAFTIMFTVLPRLGAASFSAIMNVEPIFALGLAWWVLDQAIAPSQVLGAVLVVGAVIWLGLRKTT
ncbi:MAG: DMT family transporter [Alphaproteobacteria bacterium]|nr:DMT family transporter [Alphaproteobacteria bacterium]